MATRGNGRPFGASNGSYHNPTAVFPFIVQVSAISPDIAGDTAPEITLNETPLNNDVVFIHVQASGTAANTVFTPPAGEGFSAVVGANGYDTTASDSRGQVFWKRWGTGDTDNTNIVFTSSTANARITATVVRGMSTTYTPHGATLIGSGQAMTPTLIAPSANVPVNGLLMRFYSGAATTIDLTTSETAIYQGVSYAWTAGTDGAMAASAIAASPGISTAATAASSVGTVTNGWSGITLALQGIAGTPTVAAVSAISTDTTSGSATNTIPATGLATDTIVLAHCGNSAGGASLVAPPAGEGWQLVNTISSGSGLDSGSALFWKRWGAGGGQIDNTVVTFTNGTNLRLTLTNVTGCITSGTPFATDGTAGQCDDASFDMSVTAPSLLLTGVMSTILRFFTASAPGMVLNAPMFELYDGINYSYNDGTNGAMAGSQRTIAGGGTAPIRSAQTNTVTANGWVGMTVETAA